KGILGGSSCFLVAAHQFFLDASSLARTAAQVVELGAANIATTLDFDACDLGRVQLECTLDGFAGRNLANDKGRVQTTVTLGDDNAFVCLDTLACAFNNVYVDNNSIAGGEFRTFCALGKTRDFFLFDLLDEIQDKLLGSSCTGLYNACNMQALPRISIGHLVVKPVGGKPAVNQQ